MAIDFACACGRQFRVKDELAGRRAKCPRCSRDLLVPAATSLRAAPPAYSAPTPPAYQAPSAYQQPSPYQAPSPYQQPSPQAAYQQYPPPGASLPQGDMQPPAATYAATGYPPGMYGNAPRLAAPLGSFHRRGLFITLGIILVLGFILPVVEAHRDYSSSYSRYPSGRNSTPEMKWETEFVNITGLTEKGVPFVARVLCIAPLLAGIAVLVVAFTSRGVVRGAVTGGSALLPLFIVFMAALSDDDAGRVSRRMFSQLGAGMGIVVVLAALGTTAFLAGLLASRHRPDYRAIAIVTLVGAGLYVLCHFIPTGKDIKSMPIVAAFASSELDGFDEMKGRGFMRMCDILSLLGGLAAAGLTLAFMGNKMTRERARIFFWILVGSVGLGFLGKMSMVIGNADSERLVPALLTTMKIIAWLLGLLVLIPVGLSEFLLGMAARSSAATAGHGFPVHMGYSAGGPSAYQQGGYPQESSFR